MSSRLRSSEEGEEGFPDANRAHGERVVSVEEPLGEKLGFFLLHGQEIVSLYLSLDAYLLL